MVTPVAINNIGWQYYIVYSVIGMCIPVSVFFLYPETNGRSLEELDVMFRTSPSVLGTVKHAKQQPLLARDEVPSVKRKSVHYEGDDDDL